MVNYNRETVLAKAAQCFPNHALEEIMKILDLYGKDSSEEGKVRVQLAVLKVSGGDIEKLRENVELANGDFRDVVGWAEYPEEMEKWSVSDREEAKRIRERDRQQYRDWVDGKA